MAGVNTTEQEMEVLTLKTVTLEDAGEYSCVAENAIGASRYSAWLTVKGTYSTDAPTLGHGAVTQPLLFTSDPIQPQAYWQILLGLGSFLIVTLTVTAIVCRLCWVQNKSDFSSQLSVEELSRSFPLKMQVAHLSHPSHLSHLLSLMVSVPTPQVSVESSSSLQSETCLMHQSRLSVAATTYMSQYELPYDPGWELPRDRYCSAFTSSNTALLVISAWLLCTCAAPSK